MGKKWTKNKPSTMIIIDRIIIIAMFITLVISLNATVKLGIEVWSYLLDETYSRDIMLSSLLKMLGAFGINGVLLFILFMKLFSVNKIN